MSTTSNGTQRIPEGSQVVTPAPDLLAASAMLHDALAGSEGGQGHPDADLLRAGAAYRALADNVFGLYPGGLNAVQCDDERQALLEPIEEKQLALLETLYESRATTIDGVKDRVATLLHADPDFYKLIEVSMSGYMVSALVRDLNNLTVDDPAILGGGLDKETGLPGRLSCFELATQLPALEIQHSELDERIIAAPDDDLVELNRLRHEFAAVTNRIQAISDMVLATPASTMADASAQLLLAFAALDGINEPYIGEARRAIMSSFRVVVAAAGVKLEDIGFRHYAPFERF